MRYERKDLEVKKSAAVGAAKDCRDLIDKWLQVGATFVATLEIQGTIDGTNWITISTFTDAGGLLEIPEPFLELRIETTAYTSGTPTAKLTGRNAHN